jgi:hypothetical protein
LTELQSRTFQIKLCRYHDCTTNLQSHDHAAFCAAAASCDCQRDASTLSRMICTRCAITAGTVASPAAPGATPAAASCPNTVTATCGRLGALFVRLHRLAGAMKLHLSVQLMISEATVWTHDQLVNP